MYQYLLFMDITTRVVSQDVVGLTMEKKLSILELFDEENFNSFLLSRRKVFRSICKYSNMEFTYLMKILNYCEFRLFFNGQMSIDGRFDRIYIRILYIG